MRQGHGTDSCDRHCSTGARRTRKAGALIITYTILVAYSNHSGVCVSPSPGLAGVWAPATGRGLLGALGNFGWFLVLARLFRLLSLAQECQVG